MNRFPNSLQVELQGNRRTWRLLALFSYLAPGFGAITVPPDFETDFASVRPVRTAGVFAVLIGLVLTLFVPWVGSLLAAFGLAALLLYAAVVSYGQEAAVIHDYLYATGLLPRLLADRVFRDALRSSGHARWRAGLMWAGVRLGGRSRFKKG
ncbi:DUF1353 domain-containing protein [Pseudomonas sp. GV071]|uniref:DUF1353 domain-containing protein n=1 Tax=Pseudomonas sp. GV071 TaxID=2135754 RepID=UPI000D3D13DF|nr:DUF1353 domain-containing protein [Pseudomonas sp. GV071]